MSSVAPAPNRWTIEEYFALVTAGQLTPEDRVELLEGVIVARAPQLPRHASSVQALTQVLVQAAGAHASVRVQLPFIAGSHSFPEPDVAVVPGHARDYAGRHPELALLVVEVADSSVVQDRLTKASLYAAAGVPEYWLVDLVQDVVVVARSPERAARRYADVTVARRGDTITSAALPGLGDVRVDDVVPPR
jgi:Uma2 family endonuclease